MSFESVSSGAFMEMVSDDRQWFLIYTRPRQEWLAQTNLDRQGYQVFLPLLRSKRRRRGRQEAVIEPLFPRYLFVRLSPTMDNWKPISSTLGVSSIVRFGLEPAPIPEELVATLVDQSDESGVRDAPKCLRKSGERVRIGSGVFEGYEGILEASSGKERVILMLEIAGCAKRVEMPEYDLEHYI